jgi:Secretion system C-terminal sorting domain
MYPLFEKTNFMKPVSLLATLFAIICTTNVQAQYDANFPIYASDNIQALQGIKQKVGTTVTEWIRPGASATNLSKFIGAMAVNPSNLAQVYFVDNSAVPTLYTYNNITHTETNTTKTFTGASQGSNGSTSLPMLASEDVLGINMMAISSSLNKGYAISKEHKLYSFEIGTPSPIISAPTIITDAPGNSVLFANSKGGGLMANDEGRLTALVNILQPDLTYKYYYFDINPTTYVARFVVETTISYYNFDDNTMYISGAGVTGNGNIYCALYNGNESTLYKQSPLNNFNINLATYSQSIGDVTGAGQVNVDATGGLFFGTLAIDFNDITGSFNAKEKSTTIKWDISSDEPINKFYVQASIDGVNFKTVATQTPTGANGQNNYALATVSKNNTIVYYRIAAIRPDGSQKISKIISIDESTAKTYVTTYPNPATNFVTVKLADARVIRQVNILDTRGQVVVKIKGDAAAVLSKQINLLEYNLVAGQYYIQVIFDNQDKQTIPVSIQH